LNNYVFQGRGIIAKCEQWHRLALALLTRLGIRNHFKAVEADRMFISVKFFPTVIANPRWIFTKLPTPKAQRREDKIQQPFQQGTFVCEV